MLRASHAQQGRTAAASQVQEVVERVWESEHLLHGASYYEAQDFGPVDHVAGAAA